jgi:hypothetical protein
MILQIFWRVANPQIAVARGKKKIIEVIDCGSDFISSV